MKKLLALCLGLFIGLAVQAQPAIGTKAPDIKLKNPDGKVINTPVSGYMPKEDFKKFLECGVNYYKKNK